MAGDWESVEFQTICGHSAFGPRFSSDEYTADGNVACLRTTDISADGGIDYASMPIAMLNLDKLRGHILQSGDLVITRTGAYLGKAAVFSEYRLPVLAGAFSIYFRLDREAADPWFFRYYFNSSEGQSAIRSIATGSAQPNINITNIHRLILPLPPLAEQQAIRTFLGALDDKIELNRQRNRTLESMARAIFQSWFVDFDPVRAKAAGRAPAGMSKEVAKLFPSAFEDSALGPIPKGWQIKTLEQLTTKIGSGSTPRGGEKVYVKDGIALVRSQNVYDFEFVWDGLARLTPEAAADLDGVTLEPEDILFNITGASVLRTCVVDPAVLPARVNQHVARIRAKSDVPSRFLHLNLVRDQMKQHLLGFNAGATREAVTKGHLQLIQLVVPPPPILQQFAKLIGPLYAQKETNLRESRTLAALRDALLPKLISGELRVPDAERIVGRMA